MPGHGGRPVFHQQHGDVVVVEEGVDDSGQAGMKKGGISHEYDDFAGIVKQGQPGTHPRGGPHAHKQFTHFVRFLEPQGMTANVGHGDICRCQGLLDGMERAAMSAPRTHLGRPQGCRWGFLGPSHALRHQVSPGIL